MKSQTKSNSDKIVKEEPAKELIISLENRDEILSELRQALLENETP